MDINDSMDEAGSHDSDAYIIVHHPADGSEAYAIGPYPPVSPEFIADIVRLGKCDCRREALPLAFPRGIKMALLLDPEVLVGAVATANDEGLVH